MKNTPQDFDYQHRLEIPSWYCWWKKSSKPVEVGSLSHYLRRVLYISGGAGFLPSTVPQKIHIFSLSAHHSLMGEEKNDIHQNQTSRRYCWWWMYVNVPLFLGFHTCQVVISPDFWTVGTFQQKQCTSHNSRFFCSKNSLMEYFWICQSIFCTF